jgi:hypothetical protein
MTTGVSTGSGVGSGTTVGVTTGTTGTSTASTTGAGGGGAAGGVMKATEPPVPPPPPPPARCAKSANGLPRSSIVVTPTRTASRITSRWSATDRIAATGERRSCQGNVARTRTPPSGASALGVTVGRVTPGSVGLDRREAHDQHASTTRNVDRLDHIAVGPGEPGLTKRSFVGRGSYT